MSKFLRLNLFLLATITTLLPAAAQVQRVYDLSPGAGSRQSYVDIYDYDYVDEQPRFPGGERALVKFINDTREYPYEAYKNNIEGRVLCSFIVDVDGSVSGITVVRSSSSELLNREAVRVISEMPRWTAGKIGGTAVPVKCYLPIAFRL